MKSSVEPNAARRHLLPRVAKLAAATFIATCVSHAMPQSVAPVATLAASEQPKLLDTMKTLVEIETGSTHRAGLDKISTLIADRLKALGGEVQLIEPVAADIYRMEDTPERAEGVGRMVRATFKGNGTKRILMIAHMDTVYPVGMLGVNALYELSHQVLQMRDLSVPQRGLKVNWTMSRAGIVRNMIPPGAQAWADIRLLKPADLPGLEAQMKERIKNKLLPESNVEVAIENRRPALEATTASRALASHAQAIYRELGKELVVDPEPEGGGTDAAFAALETKAPVVERFGLQGFGAHTTNAEYVLIDSIQPRLYLATRMVIDIANGKARLN